MKKNSLSVDLGGTFFVHSYFQMTKLIATKIRGNCLIIDKQLVIDNSLNIQPQTQYDIRWIEADLLVAEQVCFLDWSNVDGLKRYDEESTSHYQ